MNERKVDYSIVIPVYYNEGSLTLTYQAIDEKVIRKILRKHAK